MNSDKQKGAMTWRLPAGLIMAILALAIVAVAAREGKISITPKPYYAQTYCEPECPEPIVERPVWTPSRTPVGSWGWASDITPRCIVAVLIAGFLGFAMGRFTATAGPSANDVDAAIATEAADRQTEATRHGVAATAGPLLTQLEAQAKAAVKKLLPSPAAGGLLALALAAILVFVFLLLPATPPNCKPDCPSDSARSEGACGVCS